jgi:hypothetical protein
MRHDAGGHGFKGNSRRGYPEVALERVKSLLKKDNCTSTILWVWVQNYCILFIDSQVTESLC